MTDSMSYKLNLSDLQRDGDVSITQQLVDRFSAAIDSGELEPGAKLPPTRELAAEAGVNHLTAARVYRKLAELGYVTAQVGRGTFVRTLAPAGSASHGDDWQVYALPPDDISYSEQVLADSFSLAGREDVISLAGAMEPGSSAALLVWENKWAAPFASAVRHSGGQLVASGRIPVQALIGALEDEDEGA